eukprot:938435_1
MNSSFSVRYTWRFRDPINKLVSIQIPGKVKWVIELKSIKTEELFVARVCPALSMLPSWKCIFAHIIIDFPELPIHNKLMFTSSFAGWITYTSDYTIASLEDLKYTQALTFVITIHITRITLKDENKILFQIPTNKYQKNTQLKWKIDQQMMNKLKSFRTGQAIHSDIYHDIWFLKLYPNGQRMHNKGEVCIAFYLRALPQNVSKMRVQLTLHCVETNIEYSKIFSVDEANRGHVVTSKKNRTSFSEFLKFDTCTIIGTIDVLDEFDNNNNIIGEDKDVAVDTGGDVKLDAVNEDAIVDDEEWKQNVNVKQTREDIERGGTQHRRDVRKLAPICNKKIDQILSDLPE